MPLFPNVFERFAQVYAGLDDSRLLLLAVDMSQLEPDAQEALQAELERRNLSLPDGGTLIEDFENDGEPRPTIDSPGTIWVFDTEEAASAAHYALRQERVEALIYLPGKSLGIMAPTVSFAAEDPEKYRRIYEGAISGELYNPNDIEQDFVAPQCPSCGDMDPLLISVEPANEWACGNCGHTWQES